MSRRTWLGGHATHAIEQSGDAVINDAIEAAGDLLDVLEDLEPAMIQLSQSIESLSRTIATLRSLHQDGTRKECSS